MESNSSKIDVLFESRKNDPKWNTSYPLCPENWKGFRTEQPLPFYGIEEMSFYIHIPFCKQICSFCEYSKIVCPNEDVQKHYLHTLRQDIHSFVDSLYSTISLKGFDIGGGTPTALSEENFSLMIDIFDEAVHRCRKTEEFEPSIEATFNTLSIPKIKRIASSGIQRLSLGIQSTSKEVLDKHNRQSAQLSDMRQWLDIAWANGIKKINLDLMYGISGQDNSTIDADIEVIAELNPQQVTLYELRTNMITHKEIPDKGVLYDQYCRYYHQLTSLGYYARFGQNTFSKEPLDYGVSSYLRSRMLDGAPYKGFGISAQSMNQRGVSYNVGKNISSIRGALSNTSFSEEFTYLLPPLEITAKYIAIAGYNGSFSLKRASELLADDAERYFRDVIDYCVSKNLLYLENGRVFITEEGFRHYGAVFSLFYAADID